MMNSDSRRNGQEMHIYRSTEIWLENSAIIDRKYGAGWADNRRFDTAPKVPVTVLEQRKKGSATGMRC